MKKSCINCGSEFIVSSKYKTKKYCSLSCFNFSRRIPKKIYSCKNCGKETINEHFCSKSCSASFNNRGIKRSKSKPNFRECAHCGTHTTNPKYCSTTCAHKGLIKDVPEHIRTARKREAWQRYQAKKLNQTPPDANLELIRKIYESCPEGHEVDHIIPISKGGLHHQDNLQILTKAENRRKSNKII